MNTSTFSHRLHLRPPLTDRWLGFVQRWLAQWLERRAQRHEADIAWAVERELQHDLGVNPEGIGVILNLVDQLHGLRRALAGKLDPKS